MAKDDFAFRRFLHVAHVGSIVGGMFVGLAVGPIGGPAELAVRCITGGLCGFLAAAAFYMCLWVKDLAGLRIPEDELAEGEVVLMASPGSMVHYKSGNAFHFWNATGGRLFLTNEVLEFRAHRGQHHVYRITIPLDEIARAKACRILGIFQGGLRIERADGAFELFTFGVRGNSSYWAEAIMYVKHCSFHETVSI